MHILVLGGTSFFGAEIVKMLLEEGHRASVFTRGNKKPVWWDRVSHIQGDRTEVEDFQEKMAGKKFDLLIDNIAYQAGDVESAVAILEDKVDRYILTSTAAVYRYVPERTMPVREGDVDFTWEPPDFDPEDRGWQYAAGKLDAERVLMGQERIPYTIIRPPVVLGPGDPTLRGYFYMQRLLDGKPVMLTNGGVNSFRLVYSRDLAGAYLLSMASPQAENRVYNVTQTEIITTRDFIEASAQALEIDPELVNVPRETLEGADFEYADPYSGLENFIPSVRRVQGDLGYQSTPYRDWVKETARWYRDHYQGEDSAGYGQREREAAFADKVRRRQHDPR